MQVFKWLNIGDFMDCSDHNENTGAWCVFKVPPLPKCREYGRILTRPLNKPKSVIMNCCLSSRYKIDEGYSRCGADILLSLSMIWSLQRPINSMTSFVFLSNCLIQPFIKSGRATYLPLLYWVNSPMGPPNKFKFELFLGGGSLILCPVRKVMFDSERRIKPGISKCVTR